MSAFKGNLLTLQITDMKSISKIICKKYIVLEFVCSFEGYLYISIYITCKGSTNIYTCAFFFTEFLHSVSWSFQQNASFEQVHKTSSYYINTAQQYYKQTGQFGCPKCLKTYRHFRNLKRHLKLECGKEPQYQCPFCPRRTTHNADLKKHMKRMHLSK